MLFHLLRCVMITLPCTFLLILGGCDEAPSNVTERNDPEENKSESKATDLLQGDWKAMELETNGKQASASQAAKAGVRIEGGQLYLIGSPYSDAWNYSTDTSVTPHQINITRPAGDGPALQGIYELAGDNLILCYRMHVQAALGPPQEFATTPGSGLVLMKLEK